MVPAKPAKAGDVVLDPSPRWVNAIVHARFHQSVKWYIQACESNFRILHILFRQIAETILKTHEEEMVCLFNMHACSDLICGFGCGRVPDDCVAFLCHLA